ncbi:MAG: hypothetical protein HW386_1240 [Gammaproteobacteria bacterium]|nr:hypothetical protein [Gammaproteobacteria bacterium]
MPDQDIKNLKHGGGIQSLFGLPFLGMGLFFAYKSFQEALHFPGAWMGVVIGSIFALVGAAIVFGRSGTILDRQQRTVTTWWGLLVPFSRTQQPVGQDARVTMSKETRRTKNGSYNVYPVRLTGDNLQISMGETRDFEESRRQAEDVAKFFGLAIHDRTGGEEIVREAGTLDESVQARARRLGISTPLPPQPDGHTCTFQYGGPHATSVIELPPPGAMSQIGSLIGALIFATVVYFMFVSPFLQGMPAADNRLIQFIVGMLVFAVPVGGGAYAMLNAAKLRQRISISTSGVNITRENLLGTKVLNFPAREIEEIETTGLKTGNPGAVVEQMLRDAGDQKPKQQEQMRRLAPKLVKFTDLGGNYSTDAGSVIIRSDCATVELGAHLKRAEKEWLHNAIVHVLTSDKSGPVSSPAAAATKPAPAATHAQRKPAMESPVSDYSMQPGKVQRKSGSGWAISLVGVAALTFVLYQNGILNKFMPQGDQSAPVPVAQPSPAPAASVVTGASAPQSGTVQLAVIGRSTFPQEDFLDVNPELQMLADNLDRTYGYGEAIIGVKLYEHGLVYEAKKQVEEQEWAWLHALRVLQMYPPDEIINFPDVLVSGIDQEVVARGLGGFYWDQYKYKESYFYYDLAYKLAEDVVVEDAERNRRLASNSAGIMATACYLGKWEIADYAMAELKERMKTVSPEEQKRLDYWVRTGEPRLKDRKC